ncbi:MAG: hypothetical protein U0793_29915 [Gemmataceae bacterium]
MKSTVNEFRADIVLGLVEKAKAQAGILAMGHFVQDVLECSREAVLPVIAYFRHTFQLSMAETLPLQQTWPAQDERLLMPLRKAIDSKRVMWDGQALNGAPVSMTNRIP